MRKAARFLADLWYLMKPYFTSEEWRFAWGMLLLLLALNLSLVAIGLVASFSRNIYYTALQTKDAAGFFRGLFWFTPRPHGVPMPGFFMFAAVGIVIGVLSTYVQQLLQIRWRRWLTEHYVADWLGGHVHYRMQLETGGRTLGAENPEQRIQEDLDLVTDNALTLTIGLISNLVTIISYGGLLWSLSGVVVLWGIHVPGYLLISVLLYAAVATWLTHLTGRKLARLDFMQQRFNAQFRFSMMRVRENSEAVALLSGEAEERRGMQRRFADIYGNVIAIINRSALVSIVSGGLSEVSGNFALVISAPRFFAGRITFGAVMQITSIFNQVSEALLWFMNQYAAWASVAAQVERLATFRRAIDAARATQPQVEYGSGDAVTAHDLRLDRPSGAALLPPIALHIEPGTATAITGRSGAGKSTLFRTLAGIWPHASGQLEMPVGRRMFLPQRPYIPEGTLRRAAVYPLDPALVADDALREALRVTGLSGLSDRLDDDAPWAQILSPGEQQRLAVARAVVGRPDWLFLDEATSALDAEAEASLYAAIARLLPATTIVSITHRGEVAERHSRVLRIDEAGTLVSAT